MDRSNDDSGDSATSELLNAISQDVRQLVREELQRSREELGTTIKAGGRAGVLLGGATLLGALAAGTSAALLVRVLDKAMPKPVAGLVATGVFGAAAAGAGWAGLSELRRARQELSST